MRFEREYAASVEEVWAAVTEPEQLRGWLAIGGAVLEPRVGGRFEVRMTPGEEETAWGAVLAFDPPRMLEVDGVTRVRTSPCSASSSRRAATATLLVLDHRLAVPARPRATAPDGTLISTRSRISS